MSLDKGQFSRIVELLVLQMDNPNARRALVERALFGSYILNNIDWSGSAYSFTTHLVNTLYKYGEIEPGTPALVALLREIRNQYGVERQHQIQLLIEDLSKKQSTPFVESKIPTGTTIDSGRRLKFVLINFITIIFIILGILAAYWNSETKIFENIFRFTILTIIILGFIAVGLLLLQYSVNLRTSLRNISKILLKSLNYARGLLVTLERRLIKNNKFYVFISYSRQDGRRYAELLKNEIGGMTRNIWIDTRDIEAGKDFTADIEQNIKRSSLVFVCLSPSLEKQIDDFARREISYAIVSKKPVISLKFDDGLLPRNVNSEVLDLSGSKWHEGIERIRQIIGTEYPLTALRPFELDESKHSDYLNETLNMVVTSLQQRILQEKELSLSSIKSPEKIQKHNYNAPQIAIKRVVDNDFYWLEREASTKTDFDTLEKAYKEYKGRLLVLGEPGSGKSTTLLAFARDMITARRFDITLPLPIYMQIANWDAREQPSLIEWVTTAYPSLKNEIADLILQGKVLLILDGLDELGERRFDEERDMGNGGFIQTNAYDPRQVFMQIIPNNNFVVISSRIKDYEAIGTKFSSLNGAVTLIALNDEQLKEFLNRMPGLWNIIKSDNELLSLSRNPLLVTIIAIAFGKSVKSLSNLKHKTRSEINDAIFSNFVWRRYEFEKQKKGVKLPFEYKDYIYILSRVAATDAVSNFMEKNIIYPNYLEEEITSQSIDKLENLTDRELELRTESLIELALRLNVLIRERDRKGIPVFRFVHLLLRDYFAFNLAFDYSSSPEPEKREYAARILGQLNEPRGLRILINLLKDENIYVQRAAIQALGEHQISGDMHTSSESKASEAVDALIPFLNDERIPQIERQLVDQRAEMGLLGEKIEQEKICYVTALALKKIGGQKAINAVKSWEKRRTYVVKNIASTNKEVEKNSIKVGLSKETGLSLFNTQSLTVDDVLLWSLNDTVETHFIIWNTSDQALKNFRLRIHYHRAREKCVIYEPNSTLKHEPQEAGVDSYLGDSLLPNDRLVFSLRFKKLANGSIPVGTHQFDCNFFAENVAEAISATLQVDIRTTDKS
jgi:hypothetical protein